MKTRLRARLCGALLLCLMPMAHGQVVMERGPYLQSGTPTSVVIRWRTDAISDSRVSYGRNPGSLVNHVDDPALTDEHAVTVSGLLPGTRYYYAVGSTTATLAGGDADHFVVTTPLVAGTDPVRLWVIGDSGTAHQQQLDAGLGEVRDAQGVRDSFRRYAGIGDTLVTAGATWRYLDDGSDQGAAWRDPAFDDTTWAAGSAQLGYGDGDEATTVSCGPSAPACNSENFITTYFRHGFDVADASNHPGLTLSLLRDDGAIVYLNGTEVLRSNLPAGAVDFSTPASSPLGGADEHVFHRAAVDQSLLVDGTNVLAVEVHQVAPGSSDISFEAELFGHTRAGVAAQLWLMAGDNAYNVGTDDEWQQAVFDPYAPLLRNTVLWPVLGNHDILAADGAAYAAAMTLPTAGEAGGVASGSEEYYSFDHANVHFIALDSTHSASRQPGSAMLTWLAADLAATTGEWIIAMWHHPPYSKGSHDSDDAARDLPLVEMRENVLPMLEAGGVDLVLSGHSHSYERSALVDGFYATPTSIADGNVIDAGSGYPFGDGTYDKPTRGPAPNEGTVYGVVGSSGKAGGAGALDHPVMVYAAHELGSLVVDVDGNRLDAAFIDRSCTTIHDSGCELDRFTLIKGAARPGYVRLSSTTAAVSPGGSLPFTIRLENITASPRKYTFALALIPPGSTPTLLLAVPLTLPAQTQVAPSPSLGIAAGSAPGTWRLVGLLVRPTGTVDTSVLSFQVE